MIEIKAADIKNEKKEAADFLDGFGLKLDDDVEVTLCARDKDRIIGTCSFSGRVLKCFAVSEEYQGEGIAAKLITHLTNILFDRGIYETFIFTSPMNKGIFKGLGYREVHSEENVTLMEGGRANIKSYIRNMFDESNLKGGHKAALVMNCNPFTLGHRYLIEKASRENEQVVVFIVEENKSLFPFDIRLELVKRGTADLKNVHVVRGGLYIISSATFPSYFLRNEDERLSAYTRLDAGIFGEYIAPEFNIVKRYIGTEPYCGVTCKYNSALLEILPRYNIEVECIERLKLDNRAISASEVRSLIKSDRMNELKSMLPPVTLEFLNSERAAEIIKKIKRSDSVH